MPRSIQRQSGGSTFLPDRLADLAGPSQRGARRGSRPYDAGQPSVLVVDDDDAVRTLLTDALQEAGFRVTAVADGFSALNSVRRVLPDVVILDLGLPVL